MDTGIIAFLILGLPVLLGFLFLIFGIRKRKTLSENAKAKYRQELTHQKNKSDSERILRYDTILDHILKEVGYSGSLADKLKKKPPILGNSLDDIWRLHKIRNKIAHELNYQVENSGVAEEFERIILKILK